MEIFVVEKFNFSSSNYSNITLKKCYTISKCGHKDSISCPVWKIWWKLTVGEVYKIDMCQLWLKQHDANDNKCVNEKLRKTLYSNQTPKPNKKKFRYKLGQLLYHYSGSPSF